MNKLGKVIAQIGSAAAVALAVAAPAKADVIGFYDGTDLVARLTTSGFTDFKLDFVYAPASAGTAFINDLLLDYGGNENAILWALNLGGDTAPTASFCEIGPGCAAEGTSADVKVSWSTSNNADRFNEGESSRFQIGLTNPSLWDFSRLHINAFLNGESIKLVGSECTNGQCTPPTGQVPEPGSLTLLSLGLLAAGIVGRRKRAK